MYIKQNKDCSKVPNLRPEATLKAFEDKSQVTECAAKVLLESKWHTRVPISASQKGKFYRHAQTHIERMIVLNTVHPHVPVKLRFAD